MRTGRKHAPGVTPSGGVLCGAGRVVGRKEVLSDHRCPGTFLKQSRPHQVNDLPVARLGRVGHLQEYCQRVGCGGYRSGDGIPAHSARPSVGLGEPDRQRGELFHSPLVTCAEAMGSTGRAWRGTIPRWLAPGVLGVGRLPCSQAAGITVPSSGSSFRHGSRVQVVDVPRSAVIASTTSLRLVSRVMTPST